MVSQLVNGDNLAIMRKEHLEVDCGWDGRHGIGVTMPQKDVVVKRGVDNFNVDTNSLAGKGDRTVTENADGLGGMAIPRMKGDCGRGHLRRSKLFPNRSRHHTGRFPLINNTPIDVGISDFDWDLERNRSRKGGDGLTDEHRKQSIGHPQDLQNPWQIVDPSFEKDTTGGVPVLKWQQEIVPDHLLCYMNG